MQLNESGSIRNGQVSAVALIRSEFPNVSITEIKALTDLDRAHLASAIARKRGLEREQLAFIPVEY
jgi:hypothetical protein